MPQARVGILRIEVTPEGAIATHLTGPITPAEANWAMDSMKKKLQDVSETKGMEGLQGLISKQTPSFNPRVVS